MAPGFTYSTVDVFTKTKFAGNPLAIVKLPNTPLLTQEQKQDIAKEFNYSETVFVHPRAGEDGTTENVWAIDIFTISQELPFAGHPVIGTACSILGPLTVAEFPESAEQNLRDKLNGAFITKAGRIELEYDNLEKRAKAAIPHDIHVHGRAFLYADLHRLQPGLRHIGSLCAVSVVSIVKGMNFALVQLDSKADLAAVTTTNSKIDFQLDQGWDVGFVGMYFYHVLPGSFESHHDGSIRVWTRMIESSVGEDPATGSAACALASHLAMRYLKAGSTTRFEITQGIEMGRRSEIGVEISLDSERQVRDVWLSGSAVQVMAGTLLWDGC
jgi:PhzF family phenazine biosynthesis protein